MLFGGLLHRRQKTPWSTANDGKRVDDGSAVLGAVGNGALSQCSVVEHQNDKKDEFSDADPEDESDSDSDSALEDKDGASDPGVDAIARFASQSVRGLWASVATVHSPIPK